MNDTPMSPVLDKQTLEAIYKSVLEVVRQENPHKASWLEEHTRLAFFDEDWVAIASERGYTKVAKAWGSDIGKAFSQRFSRRFEVFVECEAGRSRFKAH